MNKEKILSIRDLHISFKTQSGKINAIRGLNLDLHKGETLAVIGESGSGKSVTMQAVMGMIGHNTEVASGSINFTYCRDNEKVEVDILKLKGKELQEKINGRRIAMIFQDPMTSLNPTMRIGTQIVEGMIYHFNTPKKEAFNRAIELLKLVGITDADKRIKNYPHQLSGGMKQRVCIAMALACNPDLLICDEPTTALDVTIQAKILELIKDLQKKLNISVIFITHDFGVVAKVADSVAVMYAGKVVEKGTAEEIFFDPKHPYTWGLLSAMPDLDTKDNRLYTIPGSPPNLLHNIIGDAFAPRNIHALPVDKLEEPPMFKVSDTHYAATWLLQENAPKVNMPVELRNRIDRMLKEVNEYGNQKTAFGS